MKRIVLLVLLISASFAVQAQTSGGPDAYGYTWKNSNHASSPPSYTWKDITTIGTKVNGLADDNVVGPFSVPSGFQFYWYPITQFWISCNGYISLNGSVMASPFPQSIPLTSGSNDWIGPHVSDLRFDGTNNPSSCYYYANNDSIVISYINVPYWTLASPGYSGSNTFQIVISSIDNSITFNYKSMSAGSTPLPIDNAVGIENNTGALGLQSQIDVVPGNLFTIKYYYPTVITYAVTDGGINWNNNERNGGYFIPVSNSPVTLESNVKNFGNQNLASFSVTDTVYSGGTALSNGVASISGLVPGDDTTITFSNSFYAQFASRYAFASRVQGITGDLVNANNRSVQKIISVNTSTPPYTLDYSDGLPDGANLSWNGGNGGVAVYIEPPVYPAKIDGSKFYIAANGTTPVGFSAMIWDDSGPNGQPGNLLDSVFVPAANVAVGSYNVVPAADTSIYITSGGVYVEWYMGGADIAIAVDRTLPASARTFEVLGTAWADYRAKLTDDFLIGLIVSETPIPTAKFNVNYSATPTIGFVDASTNSPTKWHWDFGVNNDTSNVQNPSYTYSANGDYTVCLTATNSFGSNTTCKTVTINGIGIAEELKNYKPFLYPNPTADVAFIDLLENASPEEVEFVVYSVTGQKMAVPYSIQENRVVVKTALLSKGNYFFELKLKDDRCVFKNQFVIHR